MKLYCTNCGYPNEAGDGHALNDNQDTVEYTYECYSCGHRGAEYEWTFNGKRVYSAPEMKRNSFNSDVPF